MNAYEIANNEIGPNTYEIGPNTYEIGPNTYEIGPYEIGHIDNTLLNYEKSDIFTPDAISKIMASYLLNKGSLLDPCVGNGALLKFIDLSKYDRIDVFDIKENYIKSVNNTYLQNKKHCNAYLSDFLGVSPPDPPMGVKPISLDNSLQACSSKSGARGCPSPSPSPSNIILNPPFIKIQDLSAEYRDYIKNKWPIFKEGNFDLYYVFLLKCLSILDEGGVMVAVTPNSYLYNKSAIQLRKYIIEHRLFEKIIDYGSKKIFPGISVYCCITIFTKKSKDAFDYNGKMIHYNAVNNIMQNPTCNIFNQSTSSSLGTKTLKDICIIRNGIATLRDNIFIHKKKLYDEPSWKEITNAKETKYIIFPYKDGKIIEEEEFKMANPQTFAYLSLHKEELAKRDKGNKVYPKWYSFGRSQSLKLSISPKVIYIPTFIDPLDMQYKVSNPTLFYSCLCIESKRIDDIDLILYTIEKNMDLIQQRTSKRGGGWINLSSRILYQLPID